MASHHIGGAAAATSSAPFSSLTVKRDIAQTLSSAGARGNMGTLQQAGAGAGGAASRVAGPQTASSPKLIVGDKQIHRSPSSGDRRGSGLSTPLGPLSNHAVASNNHHQQHAYGNHTQSQAQSRAGTPLQSPSHVVTGGGKAPEASMTTAGPSRTPAPASSQPFGLGLKLDQSTSSTTSSIVPAPTAPLHIKKRSTTAPASALTPANNSKAENTSFETPFPDFSAPELADPSASLVSGFFG